MDRKLRVLILCTGNSARSQMAEGLIRHVLGDRVEVYSAGTHPSRVNPFAIRAMAEIGIDISGHRSKRVEEFLDKDLDLVITVCSDAEENCPVFPGRVKRAHIGFEDPARATGSDEEILAVFRRVRDQIRERLLPFVEQQVEALS
ncbi:MAG: arsenate reductase ArsC [Calditrichaeota bacterium]|nr:MAG: arsenate reductase ArsC [Calditrichota bacterium]